MLKTTTEAAVILKNGIKHNQTTLLWSEAKSEPWWKQYEQLTQRTNWRWELHNFLLGYRCKPHTTTNVAPAELLFGRTIKGRQPHVGQTIDIQATYDQALTKDAKAKEKIKTCADARGHAQPSTIQVGDKVLEKETRAKNYPKTKNYPQMSTSSFDASLMWSEAWWQLP